MRSDAESPFGSDTPRARGDAEKAVAWVHGTRGEDELVAAVERRVRRRQRRRRSTGLAVALALALGAGFVAWRNPLPEQAPRTAVATATISSPRQLVLPDGS